MPSARPEMIAGKAYDARVDDRHFVFAILTCGKSIPQRTF